MKSHFSGSITGVVALVLVMINGAALAADAGVGRKLSAQCAACHGEDGVTAKVPGSPVIAGQHQDYLVKALNDYKTGRRSNAVMGGIAKPLSKSDIANLAAYYASLPGPLSHRR